MPPKRGGGKKGRRRGDDSSDEGDDGSRSMASQGTATSGNPTAAAGGEGGAAANAKREALKAKREARKNKGGGGGGKKRGNSDDSGSDEDFLARMLKKKAALGSDDEEESEEEEVRVPQPAAASNKAKKKQQQQQQQQQNRMAMLAQDDSSDEDEDDDAAPAPRGGGGKAGGFAMLGGSSSSEDEESEDEKPAPKPAQAAAPAPAPTPVPAASDSESEDEGTKKKKKKKKDKRGDESTDEEERAEKKRRKEEKKKRKEEKKEKKKKKEKRRSSSGSDDDGSGPEAGASGPTPGLLGLRVAPPLGSLLPKKDPLPPPTVAPTFAGAEPQQPPEQPPARAPSPGAASASSADGDGGEGEKRSSKPKKMDKFAAKLAAKAEEAKKKEAELAKLKAQVEAEEAEKRRVAEAEAAAKAEAARAAAQEAAGAKRAEEGSDGGSEDNGGAAGGTAEGSPKAPEDDQFMHDEGWVEDFGGGGLDQIIKDLQAKLADPAISTKIRKKLTKELEAAQREQEYQKAALKASAQGAQFACSQAAVNENDPQWQNALDIKIPDFSISAHNKELFHNSSLNIAHGRRYGFVGPNGQGKTTLLKMIASGDLKIPPRIDVLYVEQEVMADDTPAVEAVMRADKERWALVKEEKALLAALEKEPDEAKDARLAEVYEQMAAIGADRAEAKARRILYGLGFDAEMQVKPTKNFSGGWRMRISLARALFLEPTLLMLDEPTNHLDLNAVIWLDDYLQNWKKTLLVVSHDQDFLNSVCDEILHLDNKKIVQYKGNYDDFKEMEAQKRKAQQRAWEKQEKMIKALKASGQSKTKAEATAKSKSRESGGAKKKKGDAVATGQEAQEAKELIERPRDYIVRLEFPPVPPLNPPVVEVLDVSFRYGSNPWIFEGLNFGIDLDSRICIVGPNGSGKSTLLKLVTGALNPTRGELRRNPRLRMGIYNQHFVDRLPMEKTPVEYLRGLFQEETYQSTRNRLGRYGLQGHAHEIPMRDLSGGQKARVVFVELSLMEPHILFLDEPTNNLDIETIDALIDAINEFNGGVVLVSHDARLIEAAECRVWIVGENRDVVEFPGEFDDYKKSLLRKMELHMPLVVVRMAAAAAARRVRLAAKAAGGAGAK